MNELQLLKADEVGKILRCTGRHVRRLAREGKIPALWRNNRPLFEIEKVLEAMKVRS